jgi:hypothetical protein
MEVPQGNFLCRYLKQTKFFFLYKIREQEIRQVLPGLGTSGRKRWVKGIAWWI